jgi:hypothetical protein
MSETSSSTSVSLVPWLTIFVVIKVWGTGLAAWSWWWILLSPVPVVWFVLKHFGFI